MLQIPLLMQYPAASCPPLRRALVIACLGPLAILLSAAANPVINEIFYHEDHGANPENPLTEWIEIYNPAPEAISLANWAFEQGVAFKFPAGASIPADGFVVVAADPATFRARHPTVDNGANIFGPWVGRLRNGGETIELEDAAGSRVDRVRYADEGDWAVRTRGPLDRGHEGWTWAAAHDGGGSSLELIDPALSNNEGQNWAASQATGGSPGAANSAASSTGAPMILDVRHDPVIPRSGETVIVTAKLSHAPADQSVELFWRVDGEQAWNLQALIEDDTGRLCSEIPAHSDSTVIEFYIRTSAGGEQRTWPGPAQPSGEQETNALFQFDDSYEPLARWVPGAQPKYRIIMTEAERAELADIGDDNESPRNEEQSNAEMNCTFVVEDGTGLALRYLASVRNRGASSRNPPPNNYLVKFRSDEDWNGRNDIKFNARYPHSQVFGSWYFRYGGVETANAAAALLRINGSDLARSGGNMYGSYARVEGFGSAFGQNHWPLDPDGNFYQVRDDDDSGEEGDLRYEGANPDNYRNTYFKQTNQSEDDWSDLIALTEALNNAPDETYVQDVGEVLNIDQWLSFFALDTLAGNREGGLITSKGDDYGLYRGMNDPRFLLVPHDLDTVFNMGNVTVDTDRSIWSFADLPGLSRFFRNDVIIQRYYAKMLELLDGKFDPAVMHPMIDELLGDWVSDGEIEDAKDWVSGRVSGARDQIPDDFSADCQLPVRDGFFRTTDGAAEFNGAFRAGRALSVLLNGVEANRNQQAGTWNIDLTPSDEFFLPGLNRVLVQSFSGPAGTGEVVDSTFLDVWNDTGSTTDVSGTLRGEIPVGNLKLVTRDSYLPTHPVLVRLEFRNPDGTLNRNMWETTATLSSDVQGVTLTPDTVTIRNGLGSALVSIGGGNDGIQAELIRPGDVWKYLDDGSDQGVAWRNREFDDESWRSGPAELGYGDNDEATEVRFGPNEDNDDNDEDEKYITTYFRKNFTVTDASQVAALTYRIKRDDGMVVYLNGNVIGRDHVGENPDYLTEARNGSSQEDDFLEPGDLDFAADDIHTLLVDGTNTIAVEIHQDDNESSDISFDFELTATLPATNPGDLTITANAAQQEARKSLVSLYDREIIEVNGLLPGTATTWDGIIRVTADTIVPPDHTLTIEPGALILVDGDPVSEGTEGRDLIVQGHVQAMGTDTSPITFTSSTSNAPWGQILFDNSQSARFSFSNIHRAGHSPRGGHTGHGRVLRIMGSSVTFENCTISDNPGKIGETDNQGGADSEMIFRECHWARSVMGIETFDTGVLMEDCWITDMLGRYREDGVTDDNDAIYLHDAGTGQSIVLRRLIVANCDDDGIDTLDADLVVENCISRNVADKGMSMLGGTATVTNSLFTACDIGFSAKNDARAILQFCTITGNTTIGLQAENKNGDDDPSFYEITNSIIWNNASEIRTDYDPADITTFHTLIGQPWPDATAQDPSNLNADPLLVDPGNGNYHLTASSPARDAADPNLPGDPDGSPRDIGRHPYDPVFDGAGSEIRWLAANGPYRVTEDATVPSGNNLVIEAGTNVYFEPGTRLTINGSVRIEGTPTSRVQLTSVPGAPYEEDPASDGLPDGPPKWDGIKIVDSMDPANRIAHIDIRNAQHREGSIGIIRSQCVIDDVRFSGTHIRMIYTDDASVIIENSIFPDMFAPNEQAAALGLDNISEHIKGEGEIPSEGRYIIRNNRFGTNKGHNDVVDVLSGRRPGPIVQILNNYFEGARDEELDLGGDIYIAGNVFTNIFKDDETSDRGYANGISTGDGFENTTNMLARNIFWDVDHAINLKNGATTIFEYNTVYKVHPDFIDTFDNPNIGSVINLFVPGDSSPTPGGGAYAAGNIFSDIPRIFSNADNLTEDTTFRTPLEFFHNLVDPGITDITVGPEHPGETIYDLGTGSSPGAALFADPDSGDFALLPGSPALGAGPFGGDLGALGTDRIRVTGEPPAFTTSDSATLTVGGPGFFGYRYRVNDGPWSEELDIGNPDGFVASNPTERSAEIRLSGLDRGTYTVFVEGRDYAGVWQDQPTASHSWTVDASLSRLVINEVLADNGGGHEHEGTFPDLIELGNPGSGPANLAGLSISDRPDAPGKFVFPAGTTIPAGGYLLLHADAANGTSGIHLGFSLSATGEGVYLFDTSARGHRLIDSIEFGPQAPRSSIGRLRGSEKWVLNVPTPGVANIAQMEGNPTGIRITEWLTEGDVLYRDDWFEIHNPDPLPVPIAGFSVSDHPNNPQHHIFPPLSFIAGGGYLKIIADRDVAAGPDHAPFALDADEDRLSLFDASGRLLDEVIFGPQASDISQGRWDSSPTGLDHFLLPTGGLPNSQAGQANIPGFENALALLNHLRITEIMYEPRGGTPYEFIELRNTGPVVLDLTGLRFTDGISFTFPALTLGPGEEILVVGDLAAFESRHGRDLNIAGVFSGNLNNQGEAIVLSLPLPFDAAILRFDYDPGWWPSTAGTGRSLELHDQVPPARDFDLKGSWEASENIDGSPGGSAILVPSEFQSWLAFYGLTALEDGDGDTLPALMEFSLGLDPLLDLGVNGPVSLPDVTHSPDGKAIISFALPVSSTAADGYGAADIIYTVESSNDLVNWDPLLTKTDSTSFTGEGTIVTDPPFNGRVRARITDAPAALLRRFLRLKVEYAP
ncbi:MAG: hypothetical protein CMP28_12775 [Roseibacillus sp.]|nr:hypothetical protein [Roseibacillus sp.]